MSFQFAYEFGNGTDVGKVRKQNEDDFVLLKPTDIPHRTEKGYLAIVCDGMGGAAAGDVASSMATNIIGEHYYQSKDVDSRVAINNAIRKANESIFRHAEKNQSNKGMGTTVVVAVLLDDKLFLAHVGDSRCYLIRDREIKQITDDHTMVQAMVQKGMLTEEQAENHPEGHVLSRSVGVKIDLEVDVSLEPLLLEEKDVLLICSDGLNRHVSDNDMLQIALNNSPQNAVDALINLTNERGGQDNVTVQVIKICNAKDAIEISPETKIEEVQSFRKSNSLLYIVIGFVAVLISLGLLKITNVFDVFSLFGL